MPGSTVEFKTAKDQGLVNASQMVAYHVPVIVVQKGNPKNITSLKDFARPGLKIALGDVNATAIGKAGAKMFQKLQYHRSSREECRHPYTNHQRTHGNHEPRAG